MTDPGCPVLSIRETFAALALQGLLLKEGNWAAVDRITLCNAAVTYADALIEALNTPQGVPQVNDRPTQNAATRRAIRRLLIATERLLAEAAKVKDAYEALLRLNVPKESPR